MEGKSIMQMERHRGMQLDVESMEREGIDPRMEKVISGICGDGTRYRIGE